MTIQMSPVQQRRAPDARTARRAGGIAGLLMAGTFIVGLVIYGAVVAPAGYGDAAGDPAEQVAFLADHQAALGLWYSVIYLVFGSALLVFALTLHQRLRASTTTLSPIATAFALAWSTLMFAVGMTAIVGGGMVVEVAEQDPEHAASLWLALRLVMEGMGGGIELVGGLWLALVSVAALRAGSLGRGWCWLGLATGAAGVLSTVPPLAEVAVAVFGTGSITWYVAVGTALLRDRVAPAAERP